MKQSVSKSPESLYTTGTVARELSTSEANVRKLANQGRLASTRAANGIRLFRRDDVERLKQERAARRPLTATPEVL